MASGPKPLPKNVLALRGSWRAKDGADEQSVDPLVEIPDLPAHLLPEAKAFWERLAPELEKLGLVAKIDQAALALVCQEWAWLVYHEQALQKDIDAARDRRAAWDAEQESKRQDAEKRAAAKAAAGKKGKKPGKPYVVKPWTGGDGFHLQTANGHPTYNPHWVARNRHAMQLDRFLASFGMSPSSRGRVTPSSRQLTLPGMEAPPKEGFSAL